MTPHALTDALLAALRAQGGVATSIELQARLGVSQSTVSRALAPLLAAGDVRQTGAARARRYLLPRHIPGAGRELPVMRVDARGIWRSRPCWAHCPARQSAASSPSFVR